MNETLARVEQIKRNTILPKKLYEEDGEVTPTKTLTTAGCPDCSYASPTDRDVTFKVGKDCTCMGTTSLTVGSNVVLKRMHGPPLNRAISWSKAGWKQKKGQS